MKPSDNEIEILAAGFAIQHKNGLIRFAHALLEKYAPQASADAGITASEDVRNAALDEAIQAISRITTSYATFTSGNPQYRPESRPASAAIAEAIDTLLALKTQADKDGGQQRAGEVDERAAFEAWAYRAGMGPKFRESMFAAWEARAALSATQARQGERDA
ncbi:hypothetical protein [Achromobacter xylosoxidans]|uniref:hypothetical protein n=1 Tax=Alcaligenes xylosoxydans xylosoxydans TaxID=85698 RepID=UPI001EE9D476|nr:hypothetical protein [Achromobacter xylosoxidans]